MTRYADAYGEVTDLVFGIDTQSRRADIEDMSIYRLTIASDDGTDASDGDYASLPDALAAAIDAARIDGLTVTRDSSGTAGHFMDHANRPWFTYAITAIEGD